MNKEYIEQNIETLSKLSSLDRVYSDVLDELIKCFNRGNKLIIMGNGGSSSDSIHIAAEFVSHFKYDRKSLPAIALSSNNALITAIANDYSYDDVFKKQLESIGNKGDIIIGITTSGKSKNIINALDYSKKNEIKTILITGNNIHMDYDYVINIPSNDTSIIQNAYMVLLHMLCLDIDLYYNEHRN